MWYVNIIKTFKYAGFIMIFLIPCNFLIVLYI